MEEDQIHNAATMYVTHPILSMPFLLMTWPPKGISRYGIDQGNPNIPSLASEELMIVYCQLGPTIYIALIFYDTYFLFL